MNLFIFCTFHHNYLELQTHRVYCPRKRRPATDHLQPTTDTQPHQSESDDSKYRYLIDSVFEMCNIKAFSSANYYQFNVYWVLKGDALGNFKQYTRTPEEKPTEFLPLLVG